MKPSRQRRPERDRNEAIVRIVDAPLGKRPFRGLVDPSQDGANVAGMVTGRVCERTLRGVVMSDLLTSGGAAQKAVGGRNAPDRAPTFNVRKSEMDLANPQSTEIAHLLGQSTLTGPSSVGLGWRGLAVERRVIHAAEKQEARIEHHFLLLWTRSFEGEAGRELGSLTACRKRPGTVTTCLPGFRPATRSLKPHQVVACMISPWFLHEVEAELDRRPIDSIRKIHGEDDVALRNLMLLLMQETEAGGANGKVYAESLSVALATRLLLVGRSLQQSSVARVSALPRTVLRRVIDRMETGLDSDITLAALAAESGYSRAHFARMFKASTGQNPHRYLLDLRLRRACSMLTDSTLTLTEIAVACGFSSHSHLSTAFRTRFGMVPSAFRRDRQEIALF